MTVTTVTPRLVHRVLAVAVVVFGLVAMHHLVASGCAMLPTSHISDSFAAASPHSGHEGFSPGLAGAFDTETESEVGPVALSPTSRSNWSAEGSAFLICIAILILIVGIRKPVHMALMRWRATLTLPVPRASQRPAVASSHRQLLSISRT